MVDYFQSAGGFPVERSSISFTIAANGDILSASVRIFPNIEAPGPPKIDREAALQTVIEASRNPQDYRIVGASLIVLPEHKTGTGKSELVWEVLIQTSNPFSSMAFYISAQSGNILVSHKALDEDTIRVHSTINQHHYQDLPRNQTSFQQMSERFETSYYTSVDVYNITQAGSLIATQNFWTSYDLQFQGEPSHLWQLLFEQNSVYAAFSHRKDFQYTSDLEYKIVTIPTDLSQSRDMSNVHKQIEQLWQFFNAIDQGDLPPTPTVKIDHHPSATNGTVGLFISLRGSGSSIPDYAKHEFTHATINDVYGNAKGIGDDSIGEVEGDAMDESFSVYWPCRYFQDVFYGDPNYPPRDLDNPSRSHYSQFVWALNQSHGNGDILASTLWDITKNSAAGPISWDEIMWLGISASGYPTTFLDYGNAMAYWAKFWGQGFVDQAIAVFNQHGIPVTPQSSPPWPYAAPPARVKMASQLLAAYPNPGNPEVWIPYSLAGRSKVTVTIYDAMGKRIRRLDLGVKGEGSYLIREKAAYWDGKNEASEKVAGGVYFYHLKAGDFSGTRKLVLKK